MADRYENIRKALAMGPTPGPWSFVPPGGSGEDSDMGGFVGPNGMSICWFGDCTKYYPNEGDPPNAATAAHIAACDPDTIRALLAERDALEAAREDACVALVADIRFACGDNGKRMQPELVEFIRGLARDAERLDWLASEAAPLWVSRDRGGYELPYFDITSGRECCDPSDLRAAIDQARGKGVAGA